MKIAIKFLSILLLTKCIYTPNKHSINDQIISGIKYFCLRGVPGKASNSEVIEEGRRISKARKYNDTRMLDQALMKVIDEYYFVLALNPESENMPNWSL